MTENSGEQKRQHSVVHARQKPNTETHTNQKKKKTAIPNSNYNSGTGDSREYQKKKKRKNLRLKRGKTVGDKRCAFEWRQRHRFLVLTVVGEGEPEALHRACSHIASGQNKATQKKKKEKKLVLALFFPTLSVQHAKNFAQNTIL